MPKATLNTYPTYGGPGEQAVGIAHPGRDTRTGRTEGIPGADGARSRAGADTPALRIFGTL